METSPSQGVEVPMLADQDFEDMFLADTWTRLGRVTLREHDHVASLPSNHLLPRPFSILTMTRWQNEGAFLLIRDLTVSVFAFALVFPGVDEECML